jgi:hypothetical protein
MRKKDIAASVAGSEPRKRLKIRSAGERDDFQSGLNGAETKRIFSREGLTCDSDQGCLDGMNPNSVNSRYRVSD